VSDLFYLLATGGRTCMSGAACMKMWSMFLILPSTLEYTWSTLKLKLLPDDAARLAFLCSNKICVNHWIAYVVFKSMYVVPAFAMGSQLSVCRGCIELLVCLL